MKELEIKKDLENKKALNDEEEEKVVGGYGRFSPGETVITEDPEPRDGGATGGW